MTALALVGLIIILAIIWLCIMLGLLAYAGATTMRKPRRRRKK